ncbi:hypothetical protein ANO11243_045180 [Dothideomycetidae sp. 11243]|nr:hypothetical protein ANO11243_045180 [fungal sp. No.11243]
MSTNTLPTQSPIGFTNGRPLSGLDALAAGSQYASQIRDQHMHNGSKYEQRNYQRGHDVQEEASTETKESHTPNKSSKSSNGSVRRRISRACDQCNQLRTKCDGQVPCAHCVEFGLTCEYARERKKRGKASRKEIAEQKAAAAAAVTSSDHDRRSPPSPNSEMERKASIRYSSNPTHTGVKRRRSSDNMTRSVTSAATVPNPTMVNQRLPFGAGDFASMDDYHRNVLQHSTSVNGQNVLHGASSLPTATLHMQQYAQNPYAVPSPSSQPGGALNQFRIGDSPMSGIGMIGNSPHAGSPSWLDLPSPSASIYANAQQSQSQQSLRYPVLMPILPRISSIIPISLACDLLDIYFASSSAEFVQPASPYILGFVLRRRSVLRKTDARPCSRALLASMLWVGAQTSENSFLTSPPSQRGKVCHQLLDLTIALLKPLVHTNAAESAVTHHPQTAVNGVALGGFGVANPAAGHDTEGGSTGAAVALDDVITYINLATVVSASEYKAASLRWWNAAWSLARELKLGRELPPNPPQHPQDELDHNHHLESDLGMKHSGRVSQSHHRYYTPASRPGVVSEEEREERRRIWWLLYTVDRHLALCYNRPLFLLDVECDGLLQPENETVWQSGEFWPPENYEQTLYFRRRGPCFECTGHGIFGYFLPLMTILGAIVDINHAKNHPRFGMRSRTGHEWDEQINDISNQLQSYGRSLQEFEARFIPPEDGLDKQLKGERQHEFNPVPAHLPTTGIRRMTEAVLQTRIVVAYSTHLMHTLHILLNGKWDPISLLDDNDLWISSQSFISATGHAVSAAEAISDILEYDPDLSFMPFFFGIYLLQGSFLLLLIADKLQGEASPSVVKACETIVRAHEVCVVTLNTEYQRNFRKVMRSALAQVKGRLPEDFGEQQQRRREVLALYRWTGDGQGLAL